jgi:hypothetical protein
VSVSCGARRVVSPRLLLLLVRAHRPVSVPMETHAPRPSCRTALALAVSTALLLCVHGGVVPKFNVTAIPGVHYPIWLAGQHCGHVVLRCHEGGLSKQRGAVAPALHRRVC